MDENIKQYQVPETTAQSLRAFITAKNDAISALGTLEVEYTNRKSAILSEISNTSNTLNGLIKAAAKELKVPTEQNGWNLDIKTMTFVRMGV